MELNSEVGVLENLKLYDEILAITKLCENQENDLNNFDMLLSALPVDNITLLKDFAALIFRIGIVNPDQSNIESYLIECCKENIEYNDIIQNLQFENRKLEEEVNEELSLVKNLEDRKTDLLKNINSTTDIIAEINDIEKKVKTLQEKQAYFPVQSLSCLDNLVKKLDQIKLKKQIEDKAK